MRKILFEILSAITTSAIILSVVIIPLAMPISVYAATQDLACDSQGSDTGGWPGYSGGAVDYTNLNSLDDDTSYWGHISLSFAYNSVNMQNYVGGDTVTNVRMTLRHTAAGSGQTTPYILIGGTRYYGAVIGTGAWATYTQDWATNPATGVAWTTAGINAAEFGIRSWGGASFAKTSYLMVTVTYTATVPIMTTSAASYVLVTTSQLNGTVTSAGGSTIDARGFVWDTVSRADPGNTAPNATAYANSYTEYGAWGTGAFSYNATMLATDTTYYSRAAAHNTLGWAYGDEIIFTTVGTPAITTVAASNIAATTARLNGLVTDNGQQACDVRFGYDTVTHAANFTAYATITPWVYNTYNTGSTPYVDIAGLIAGTTYYFNVQISNDAATATGVEATFVANATVGAPSNLISIPTSSTISWAWTKGSGATNTYMRYKIGSYPVDIADGTLLYNGSEASYLQTSLTPGITYYVKAWGLSGATYSAANTTALCTTLPATAGGAVPATPTTPAEWWQAPNYTNMAGLPFYDVINWSMDTMTLPLATGWFVGYMLIVVLLCALIQRFGEKMAISIVSGAFLMIIGSAIGLVSLFFSVPFAVIAVGSWVTGLRA